jgi:lipopolysaccharide export system protein LptC
MISLSKEHKLYLGLAVFALVSYGLVNLFSEDEKRHGSGKQGADYFSTGYTKWEMDERGKLKNKLEAEKVTQYGDNTSHSINPVMSFYNEKTPPWIVKSETGIMSADGKDLTLQGKAFISRAKAEGVKELIINTTNLRVKPETSYAETDDWAELLSPPNVTTGTGMKMVFATPVHLELLNNVKGKYETNK